MLKTHKVRVQFFLGTHISNMTIVTNITPWGSITMLGHMSRVEVYIPNRTLMISAGLTNKAIVNYILVGKPALINRSITKLTARLQCHIY